MQIGNPNDSQDFFAVAGDLRSSGKRHSRMLVTGTEGAIDNYKLSYGAGGNKDDWKTPRHRHNFEQIRHPLRGDLIIGHNTIVPEGWVSYFPESCWYGPQVRKPDLSMIVLQFAGPSGYGYDTARELKAGMDALVAKGGEFKNGMYSWVDEEGKHRNQDAAEAIYEENRGEQIVYPEPRYDRLLMFNPAAYPWVEEAEAPGVSHKWMGTFTEKEIRFGFIKIEAGATFKLGTQPAVEVMFLKTGTVLIDGTKHDTLSGFSTEAADAVVELTAAEPAELFYAKLPTFSAA
ncbi:hypothetical protein GCM10023322_64370 [Rugosimonospora acidiphila]|uniref:Uncharacterized protein n=1 Tax=Rugosimonospora acidiphila TaxID=556531 RepID=A0ABP9SGV4_9ACTN